MKDRRPRKQKKQLKKLKAAKDAIIMVQAAMSTAMGCIQMASIQSRPILKDQSNKGEKAIAIADCAINQANVINQIMSQIKDWREYDA